MRGKKELEYYHPALFYVFKTRYKFLLDFADPVEVIKDVEQLAAELKAYSVIYHDTPQVELFKIKDAAARKAVKR